MEPSTTATQNAAGAMVASPLQTTGVPWYLWCAAIAVTSSCVGMAWDVAWHRSIGRDSFWTPPHMAVYACGILAGIIAGYLIFTITFGRSSYLQSVSVNVLGFRAPLGAFIAAWGGGAMLTSAPFDNWWHAAYGFDLKVGSPPHVVLLTGVFVVSLGALYLILPAMNRTVSATDPATQETHKRLRHCFLYVGGVFTTQQMFFLVPYVWEGKLHSASSYTYMAILIPLMMAMLSTASRSRWAATSITAVYTALRLGELWILPLFPAQPRLGPVYFPVTHLVPAKFPVLIILPAIALDLLWQRTRGWAQWKVALVSGVLFMGLLVAIEWPFASFLMTKAANNRFFGSMYFNYNSLSTSADRRRIFDDPSHGMALFTGLLRATVYSIAGMWCGFRSGKQMRRLQR